jgi:hypothetical protein
MHLHGHDFRLLNGQGENAPLKNIVDIMPMETDTLEFNANVEGDWFFHCHILYHMMSGMGRVFTYENQAANPLIPNPTLAKRKLFARESQCFLLNSRKSFQFFIVYTIISYTIKLYLGWFLGFLFFHKEFR